MSDAKQDVAEVRSLKHQFDELRERASKDALSGLLNRGTLELYINRRLQSMTADDVCALFIVDIDNFKNINDTFGHQAGDQAIRQSARILSGIFRANDIVGRLGGDEFIVFMVGQIPKPMIRKNCQEICQGLQLTLSADSRITMTVSVGAHVAKGAGHHFNGLYRSADLALYKAKKNGKHRFFINYGNANNDGGIEDYLPVNTLSLSGLLEKMDSGIALLEMGDVIRLIYVSPSFCRIIGANIDTYTLPRLLCDVIHPDDLPRLESALRAGLNNDDYVEDMHRVSADGVVWHWWHMRAIRIEYNNPNPVMLVTTTDVSRFKESEYTLRESNERLQSAFEQTTQGMWEVDIASRTFILHRYSRSAAASEAPHGPFPDFLLSNGWIHPTSAKQFRKFAQELLDGRAQGYGNFVIQYQDTGCYGWATLSYRQLCDDNAGSRAIGIIERSPRTYAINDRSSFPRHALPDMLTPYLIGSLSANLTQDSVQELWLEGKDLTVNVSSCSEVLGLGLKRMFSADERQSMGMYLDVDKLLESYARGERLVFLDYRRIDGCGSICWVNYAAHMVEDPLTRDVMLFACLLQADARHRREIALGIDIVRDPATNLYDRATMRALVEFQIKHNGNHDCAMAIIQFGGLGQLYTGANVMLNKSRNYIARSMAAIFGAQCIVGQYSRDELIVFFPEAFSQDYIKRSLYETFSFLRHTLADLLVLDSLRFIAGLVTAPSLGASYVNMSSQCIQLCQLWRNSASDTVATASEDNDRNWNELRHCTLSDQIAVRSPETERPLSEHEKDVALRCVSAMLSSDSLDNSMHSVLNVLGSYHQADRVYILALSENRHVVIMPYEWTNSQKSSIQQAVSGLFVERFPMLTRCLSERAPVFLTRIHPYLPDDRVSPDEPWHFAVFPLCENESITGFLCIENARRYNDDAALIATIIPHIMGEQKRFHSNAPQLGDAPGAFLTGLPNLRSYMNVIYTLNSDLYSSLGAVCLDVPCISSINSQMGFEYGSKLLWYVSKMLSDILGNTFLFRTWDAEFVALCPDTTRQVFVGRCNRLRSALQRRYPKDVRIGFTWSEGVFTGKNLVNEARSIMRCDRVKTASPVSSIIADSQPPEPDDHVFVDRFTVYFQPRVNMATRRLAGAEALVRGLDAGGHLIPPDRFIRKMEETGDIRDLDMYVLDRTLAQMERWRVCGYEQFPVSVNFSRFTLFDPAAPASVLAIQSRYPLLRPELLEIEITESAGNVSSSSLTEIMERFRESGIRFALDDFGSQYANIAMFTRVKFDFLKLDRTLISDLATNSRSQMLVRDLVDICHTYGMLCIAEGVETQSQIDALLNAGCSYGQGYHFDRPLPAEAFEKKYLHTDDAE